MKLILQHKTIDRFSQQAYIINGMPVSNYRLTDSAVGCSKYPFFDLRTCF